MIYSAVQCIVTLEQMIFILVLSTRIPKFHEIKILEHIKIL